VDREVALDNGRGDIPVRYAGSGPVDSLGASGQQRYSGRFDRMARTMRFFLFLMFMGASLYGEVHSGSGYTLDYRKWFKSSYPGLDAMFLAPGNTTGTYHENITVVITPYPSSGVTDWGAVRDSQVSQLKGMVKDFTMKSWTTLKVGRLDGSKMVYTGKYDTMELIWTQYYVLKKGNWYTISYVGDAQDYDKYAAEAEDIIKSMEFK